MDATVKAVEKKGREITYNPYVNDTFAVKDTQEPADEFYTMLLFYHKGLFEVKK